MFTASEFRRIARDKLRGHWGRSVLVTFIFSLICGISSIYNLAKNMGHMDFDMLFAGNYNDFLAGFAAADTETSLFGSLIALVLSIVVLLFSGALEMGLNKYYIDLVAENRQGEVSVIFSRFDIFLKAMGLNLFMALFIWLWSLLFIVPGIIAAYRYCLAPYLMAENPNLGIREAVNMSNNTVAKHVEGLVRKGLITTEHTTVKTRDGRTHNGSLLYTLCPLAPVEQAYFEKQIQQASARMNFKAALEKYGKRKGGA